MRTVLRDALQASGLRALVAIAAAGLASGCGPPGALGTSRGASGAREDRVVVGGYGEIVGMAASQRMIFAASPSGLATYDRLAQRWLPPLADADGYPAGRITAIAGDPDAEGVWIGALGEVLFYRPAIDQLIRTIVASRIDRIVFDRDDPSAGAYVGSGDDWTRVSPGGFSFRVAPGDLPSQGRRIASATFESLAEEIPALGSFSALLTRDEALRSWRPTSAAQVRGMSEVWLGTLGGGVYLADPLFNRARHIPFGLFEPGASALALASDGVWVASLGSDPRGTGGVTFAATDLQSWRWLRGPADGSMASLPSHDMLVRDGSIWVVTERGIARRDARDRDAGGSTSPEWSWVTDRGIRRTYSLAALGGNIWAGTDAGVLLVGPVGGASAARGGDAAWGTVHAAGAGRIRALLVTGDSLWTGSTAGLGLMRIVDGVPTLIRESLPGAPNWLRRPVVALARSDSILVVAVDARIGIVDLRTGTASVPRGDPDLSRLGHLTTVAVDDRTIWVGGERGALVLDRTSGLVRSANVPGVAPEPVFDIALQADFAWLATPAGLVRIRRLSDGGVR